MDDHPPTYVWTPWHKNHKFEKAGVYNTYMGLVYMWKCAKCGDVEIKVEKPKKRIYIEKRR